MEQSGGRSRVLCWELVGLICFAGGDTSKQGEPWKTKETQGKQRKNKGSHGNPRKTRVANETQEKQGAPMKPKENSINKRNTFQSMGFLSKQGQYFTVKWKREAIASDGGYSIIGGRYCLLAWE